MNLEAKIIKPKLGLLELSRQHVAADNVQRPENCAHFERRLLKKACFLIDYRDQTVIKRKEKQAMKNERKKRKRQSPEGLKSMKRFGRILTDWFGSRSRIR